MAETHAPQKDYSGVPTSELAAVYARYADVDFGIFADRIGHDERDLKKVLISQYYPFTGLRIADEICMGLDRNVTHLIFNGELHIVPARESLATAMKIVEDYLYAQQAYAPEFEMTKIEKQVMAQGLVDLRRELCQPTEAQIARSVKNNARPRRA